ncbi:MAG: sulfate adenylyltransferase [Thermoprotei archaeon]|nr:MAG: sulfate adenylyltransferase [Thermoprotei archaeon]
MVSRPHGGRLVQRVMSDKRREALLVEARELAQISLGLDVAVDVENIAHGVFSPLEGFLCRQDYEEVLRRMRLSNDVPWTIPIVLDVDKEEIKDVREGDDVALVYGGKVIALMRVEEIYGWNKKRHVVNVYKTDDVSHPGVKKTLGMKEVLIGGKIDLLDDVPNPYSKYTLRPKETRVLFKERGWKTIVGFQTRNAPHRGHEYVQKAALTFVDGLFINPLVGWKKPGDYKDEVILACYETLIKKYNPREAAVLAVLRTDMRYAGTREAINHSIMKKNIGCTHFIVGRDHAGVGDFYGPYEAWEIFDRFPDLGITPLFIREAFYCHKCGGMVNAKICPHEEGSRIRISGTKIRRMLIGGKRPSEHVMRPEVAEVILSFDNPFIK